MNWFYVFCYLAFVYGISVIFTHGVGPAYIFLKIRKWAEEKGDNIGLLFKCMLCFPTNVGILFSLFNWFFLPIAITPFNIILGGYEYLWPIACIMDGCLAGGICQFVFNIYDYVEKSTPEIIYDEEDDE